MIDTRLLIDDFEDTARRLARKGVDPSLLSEARDLAERRRETIRRVDNARSDMNAGSSRVGALMREGKRDEAEVVRAQLADAKSSLEELESTLRQTEGDLDEI